MTKGGYRRSSFILHRSSFLFCLAVLLLACRQQAPTKHAPTPQTDVKTLDSVDPRPVVLQPPPVLTEEAPLPKTSTALLQSDAPAPPSPQDEALRASLPFSPAIALDPVDGSKISIRATTPTFEIKGRVYYFTTAANKAAFQANPQQYLKGPFALPKNER